MNYKRNKRFALAVLFSAILAAGLLCGCGQKGVEIFPEGTMSEAKTETSGAAEKTPAEENSKDKTESTVTSSEDLPETEPSSQPSQIFVDVCGAVRNPGVYSLSPDSRVFQAIEAAGGLSEDASAASVNQAQPLSDGQQVYVPAAAEVEAGTAPAPGSSAVSGTAASAGENGAVVSKDGAVNINTADAETLKTLSGIGDAKAAAIISYREENGGFQTVEDIMQVSGIGEATFSKLKDKITVTD